MNNKTLTQLYLDHKGKVSDKWSLYLEIYNNLFTPYRSKNINLLEIGIQNGGSLEIWGKYFENAEKIVGCDINPNCCKLTYADNRIAVVVDDANTDSAECAILSIKNQYDIIIDDGSHTSSDIVRSFARYFPHINNGGLFIAEDLHCSYWREFQGGLFDPFSSISFFKQLTDIVNHEHWGIKKSRSKILEEFSNLYDVDFNEEILSHIHSVEFINSVCVVRKNAPNNNASGVRKIVGLIEVVQEDTLKYNNNEPAALDQSENIWSEKSSIIDKEVILQLNNNSSIARTLLEARELITRLKRELEIRDEYVDSLCEQRDIINADLMRLYAERATFGAKIGRSVTGLRAKIAPTGTKRSTVIRLTATFINSLYSTGLSTTLIKTYRAIGSRILVRVARIGLIKSINNQIPGTNTGSHIPVTEAHTTAPELTRWIEKNEPTTGDLEKQRLISNNFEYKPKISVILPIYRVPKSVLNETIKSLEQQTYTEWQACIVWSDVEDLDGWKWLQDRCKDDKRFSIKLLLENGGISSNSNMALELVTGEFIALLDHDDTLAAWAFYEVVKMLQEKPDTDFIYSDKDSITADGHTRLNALFKPDWSPEMLHSVNYLTHLNIIRTSLVRKIGGWRPKTDGAQDWDIFFRVSEVTKKIERINSILYHWRVLPTSTATGMAAKPYAALGQLKAQQDYFMRRGLKATVLPSSEGMFRVNWPVQKNQTDIVIVKHQKFDSNRNVIKSLLSGKAECIRSIQVIYELGQDQVEDEFNNELNIPITFIGIKDLNWRTALEASMHNVEGESIILLDGSVSSVSDSLTDELSGWVAQHPDIAWVSGISLDTHDVVIEAGRVVSEDFLSAPLFSGERLMTFGWFGGPMWYRNSKACSPHAVSFKASKVRSALEESETQYGNRSDFTSFCLALSADGKRGLVNPFAKAYFQTSPEKKWLNDGLKFHNDPYFNPAFDQVSPLRLKQ